MSVVYGPANDGYSGYRCLAAIRDTTLTLVIQDALSALLTRESCPSHLVEWRTDVVEWRTELQRVQTSITKEYVKLNRSYWRDDIFDIVAKADDMCIMVVNAYPPRVTTGLCPRCTFKYR